MPPGPEMADIIVIAIIIIIIADLKRLLEALRSEQGEN